MVVMAEILWGVVIKEKARAASEMLSQRWHPDNQGKVSN